MKVSFLRFYTSITCITEEQNIIAQGEKPPTIKLFIFKSIDSEVYTLYDCAKLYSLLLYSALADKLHYSTS